MSDGLESLRQCPNCRHAMTLVGPVESWSTDPPPVDAAEYELYRCACGCEVAAKPDGTATRDARWTRRLEVETKGEGQ